MVGKSKSRWCAPSIAIQADVDWRQAMPASEQQRAATLAGGGTFAAGAAILAALLAEAALAPRR